VTCKLSGTPFAENGELSIHPRIVEIEGELMESIMGIVIPREIWEQDYADEGGRLRQESQA
jgi:hypothetical protein